VTAAEILATLKKLGKPSTAAIYKRHGSGDNVYGVLTSEVGKLVRKIKVDHPLAMSLWKTGNAEARMLALQIADPGQLTTADAEAFLDDPNSHFNACYLSVLLARSPVVGEKLGAWMKSSREAVREAGYALAAARLKQDAGAVSDADAERMLKTIEAEIHGSPNRARHTMNNALIAIGVYKPSLRKKAIDAAKRIGKVEVDHGETGCKTPDAAATINKASKRKRC
jgi:3-methyladenine DNA glycosylase AlkD